MTVEETWKIMKTSIEDGIVKYIPSKISKKRKSLPYISADLDRKMTLRDRLETRSKKKGALRIEQRYKQLKRECQRQLRHEHHRYVENLLTDDGSQNHVSKKFWSYLKHKRGDTCGIGTPNFNPSSPHLLRKQCHLQMKVICHPSQLQLKVSELSFRN